MFDERLQRQALASFERSGVEVRTGVRVVEVTQEQARLSSAVLQVSHFFLCLAEKQTYR